MAEAIRDWRAWTTAGRARRAGSTLILRAERLNRRRMVRAVRPSPPEPVVKLIDLERRLAHIEAARSVSAPTRILTDRA